MALRKKMYWCPNCEKAQLKSMFERKVCDWCRTPTPQILVPYSNFTLAAWGILIACTIVFLIYRDMDYMQRLGILGAAVVASLLLGAVGVSEMKREGERIAREKFGSGECETGGTEKKVRRTRKAAK